MEGMRLQWFSWVVAGALVCPALTPAQGWPREAFGGAALGALIGGLAGADCGQVFSGNGAAIGAGIGLAAGTLLGLSRDVATGGCASDPGCTWPAASTVSVGYGYTTHRSGGWIGYSTAFVSPMGTPAAAPVSGQRPNYILPATLAGAASGALIGAGTRAVGPGLAIGAAAGLLVGTLAEQQAQASTGTAASCAPAAASSAPRVTTEPPTPSLPSPHAQITSRPCPTSTYYWTAPPPIPDAPRVPEAPRF